MVDEYDALLRDAPPQYLPTQIGLPGWPNAKLLVTTRRDGLKKSEEFSRFEMEGHLDAHYVLPSSTPHIIDALEERLQWDAKTKTTFTAVLKEIPSLRVILRNSLVRELFIQGFELISKRDLKTLERTDIYECAILHWIATAPKFLDKETIARLQGSFETLAESFNFSVDERVAFRLYQTPALVPTREALESNGETSNPWFHIHDIVMARAKLKFGARQQQKDKDRAIITEEDYLRFEEQRSKQFMASSILTEKEGVYGFGHKSSWEFCVSRCFQKRVDADNLEVLTTDLNTRNIQEEAGVVGFMLEWLGKDKNRFIATPAWARGVSINRAEMVLLSQIKQSTYPSEAPQAAGNAITILKHAKMYFSSMSFPSLHAENADGSYGAFHATRFPKGKLINFNFTGANINQANFHDATLENLMLGERPTLVTGTKVNAIACSPDGSLLAIGSRFVDLYKTDTDQLVHTLKDHQYSVTSVAFSPTDDFLVSGSQDKTLRLWRSSTGEAIHTFEGHTGSVTSVTFAKKGSLIVSASEDETIRLWDRSSFDCVYTFSGKHPAIQIFPYSQKGHRGRYAGFQSVAISPTDEYIVSGSWDVTVRLWGIRAQSCLYIFEQHILGIQSVAFSPKGDAIVSGSLDGTVCIMDVGTYEPIQIFEGSSNGINCIAFSPKDNHIFSGGDEGMVRSSEISRASNVNRFDKPRGIVAHVTFSPNGDFIASSGGTEAGDKTVCLFDVATRKYTYIFKGHFHWITGIAFHPKGELLVSSSQDGTVRLWNILRGEAVHTFEDGYPSLMSVAFSNDGSLIAAGDRHGNVHLWDASTYKYIHTFEKQKNSINCLVFSPEDDCLISGSSDTTLCVWDVETHELLHTLEEHTGAVLCLSYSYDGNYIASGSDDRTIRVWEVDTYQNVVTFRNHKNSVKSIAFSPPR